MRTTVVLPAPLGPSSPNTVPRGTSMSTPSRATTSPKRFLSPLAMIAASANKASFRSPGDTQARQRLMRKPDDSIPSGRVPDTTPAPGPLGPAHWVESPEAPLTAPDESG